MAEDLPFLLREQAWDRFRKYRAAHLPGAGDEVEAEAASEAGLDDEDRLEPGPGQVLQEYRRLRHAAEMAEAAYQRAEAEGTLG